MKKYFLIVILGVFTISCIPTKSTSTLYSDSYDIENDLTSVMIFPYGDVKIPGNWTKTSYNSSSRQHFFKDSDSTTFAVALNPWDKYEFYRQGMTANQFVKAFYDWDSAYWQQQTNGQVKVLREDLEGNYIVWHLKKEPNIDSYFLYGLKSQTVFNLYVATTKLNQSKIIELLEKSYSD